MTPFLRQAGALALLAAGSAAAGALPLPDPDTTRIRADLEFLCRPELAGRETASPGAQRAAAFLAQRMEEAGLVPIRPGGLGGVTPFHYTWTYAGAVSAEGSPGGAPASDVVGILPGSDPAVAGQFVFVTAHFDHLGCRWGQFHPGADDNASGSAGLLEAGRLLRDAKPRRTIAFLAVSGEEEGLLGSEAFLRRPPVPVAAIKADINMDMIGRGHPGELHVMPAGAEGEVTTLTRDARGIAAGHHLPLSAGLERFWRDSDHYSFARRGIPAICFNTGLHPDYHQPTDTPDRIDYGKLSAVVRIVRDLALETANAGEAPTAVPEKVWQAWTWGPFRVPGEEAEATGTGFP